MIREDLIKFIEKCDFEVLNKDDYDNMEIKDLKNNEMLDRYLKGPQFNGEDGRSINLQENCVEIGLNDEINLRKEGLEEFVISYTIDALYLKDVKTGFKIVFLINYVSNLVSVTIVNYGKTREEQKIIIDINSNDSQTYMEKIMDFLSKNNSRLENINVQEGLKIILPLAYEEIEKLVCSYNKSEDKSNNIK